MSLVLCGPGFFQEISGEAVYARLLAKALRELVPGTRVFSLLREFPDARYLSADFFRVVGKLGIWGVLIRLSGPVIFTRVTLWPLAWPLYLRKRPYIFVLHGVEAWRRFPPLARMIFRKARGFWSVSRYTAKKFLKENGLSSPWSLLPPALDPYFKDPGKSPLGGSHRYLMTVARLSPDAAYKGVDLVIRVLPGLLKDFSDLHYVVIGGGSLLKNYYELALSLGVGSRVHFLGARRDVERFLRAAEIFVLISRGEGFGIVFLEAMFFRKPLVGASEGGIPEVVRDGENGLLVPYGDLKALSQTLKTLLSQKEEARRLGENGYRILKTEYTFSCLCRRLRKELARLGWG